MTLEQKKLLEFAKWFVHSRRIALKYQDNINAIDFASSLMSELCAIPVFQEHKLLMEYDEYQKHKLSTNAI